MKGETVKHKWKNLRDCYIKYLKYTKGSTGSAKKYQNWPWAAHLEFLKDTIIPRLAASNIPNTNDGENNEQDDANSEPVTADPSQIAPPTKIRKKNEVTEDVASVFKYLENRKNDITHLDHTDHLFLTYSNTFKKFSPKTQVLIKMELAQLFGQAELREIDAHTSNQSSS